MTIRIGFVGTPGSGKTSTARAIAAQCRRIEGLKSVEIVSEYARRYISKHDSIDFMWEQYRILHKQLEWETSVENHNLDLMITDSPIFVGFAYSIDLRNKMELSKKEDMVLKDLFSDMIRMNNPRRYDIIFHIPPVLQPVDDGVRPKSNFDNNWRLNMDKKLQVIFDIFPPKYRYELEMEDLQERVDFCISKISDILKLNKKKEDLIQTIDDARF